jgi:hypothetical protein
MKRKDIREKSPQSYVVKELARKILKTKYNPATLGGAHTSVSD